MKPSMQLRLSQHLALTPQLQQAIRLLQLSTLELQAEIQDALEANLMLESDEASKSQEVVAANINTVDAKHQEQTSHDSSVPEQSVFDEHYQTKIAPRAKLQSRDFNYNDDNRYVIQTTLRDHLYWQMELTPFNETERTIAIAIIDAIGEDGYLRSSLIDIMESVEDQTDITMDCVERVLRQVQGFEPAGVGARNLSECLLIQLHQIPASSPHCQHATGIIQHDIDLLGKRDYDKIKRHHKLKDDEFAEIMELILRLNPRPGNAINPTQAEYVIPDVLVRKHNHQWVVALNEASIPKLRINSQYAGLIQRADTSSDNQLLKTHLQEARWFVKSIQSRHETLLKVAKCIVDAQQDFFEYGEEAMKPMVLQDIAAQVDMHESTISRVTTQKYMHTPKGIFELKYFFSSHVSTQSGGECSSTAIRALIKKLIKSEDRRKPLSDNKIAKLLDNQGVKVARRTVAKYRESLHIPPSNERKSWV